MPGGKHGNTWYDEDDLDFDDDDQFEDEYVEPARAKKPPTKSAAPAQRQNASLPPSAPKVVSRVLLPILR